MIPILTMLVPVILQAIGSARELLGHKSGADQKAAVLDKTKTEMNDAIAKGVVTAPPVVPSDADLNNFIELIFQHMALLPGNSVSKSMPSISPAGAVLGPGAYYLKGTITPLI